MAYRYVKQDNRWDQKADMIENRLKLACGKVTNPATGKEEVVAAGGASDNVALSSTEIYTVEDNTWRQGMPLPKALKQAASLQYEDSFLILGGHDGGCSDSIYKVESHTRARYAVESFNFRFPICLSQR